MSVIREWANQATFLTSILAGFSLSAALQLLFAGRKQRLTTWAAAMFIVATAMLLVVTALGSIILMRWEVWQQADLSQMALARIYRLRGLMNELLMIGVMLFLGGLTLASWTYSRLIGLVALFAATVAGMLILWAPRFLP